VPRVSEFYGIVIAMFFNDHAPPHFHAAHAGRQAMIDLTTLEVLEGELAPNAVKLVRKWAQLHRGELRRNWDRAREGLPLDRIAPLE
jgi:hypothetical protein